MGTWAADSFGNDAAGDWVVDLKENPTYSFIKDALQATLDDPGDADINSAAIAAAETLCIVKGTIPSDYEEVQHNLEDAVEKLRQQSFPDDLLPLALLAVQTIEEDSELKELWEEDEDWINAINELKARILQS